MSEAGPESLHAGDRFRRLIENVNSYPSEETINLVATDHRVLSVMSWRLSDQYVDDPEANRYQMMGLTEHIRAKHDLSASHAVIALACCEVMMRQAREAVQTGIAFTSSINQTATVRKMIYADKT